MILRPDAGFPSMFEEYVRSFLSGLETELIKSLGKYYKHMDYKYWTFGKNDFLICLD